MRKRCLTITEQRLEIENLPEIIGHVCTAFMSLLDHSCKLSEECLDMMQVSKADVVSVQSSGSKGGPFCGGQGVGHASRKLIDGDKNLDQVTI